MVCAVAYLTNSTVIYILLPACFYYFVYDVDLRYLSTMDMHIGDSFLLKTLLDNFINTLRRNK